MRLTQNKLKAGAVAALAFFVFGFQAIASDVKMALSDHTAFEAGKTYRPWRQFFAADGTTIYFGDGPSSVGKWEMRGDQYCSLWPPAEEWACYNVEISSGGFSNPTIVWIAEDGSRTAGDLFDGDQTALRAPPKP